MNKQLRVFTNDISSVLDSSTKSKYSAQSCLNKQQHRVQCEIRKLKSSFKCAKCTQRTKKKQQQQQKTGKWTRKWQCVSSGNTNADLFFSERYIFLRAIICRCESILSEQQSNKNTANVFRNWNSLNEFGT